MSMDAKLWQHVKKSPVEAVVKFIQDTDGVNPNLADSNGRTPLHIAAMRASQPIAAALIDKKANVDTADKKRVTALHIAAGTGALDLVRALVDAKANIFAETATGFSAESLAGSTDIDAVAKLAIVDKKRFNATGRTQAAAFLATTTHDLLSANKLDWGFSGCRNRVASGDMKSPGGFQDCPGSAFSVRQSGYAKSKQKGPSARPFYDLHAVEAFYSSRKPEHVSRYFNFPDLEHHSDENMAGLDGIPKFLVMVQPQPMYEPANPIWGNSKEDGETHNLIQVWSLSEYAQAELREGKSNSAQLLKRFFLDDGFEGKPSNTATDGVRVQLKAIGTLTNPDDLKVSGMLRKLIVSNNSKPFMTGPRCHNFWRGDKYLEIRCDTHKFVYVARKGLYELKDTILSGGKFNFGLLVEGRGEAQQPEQMLATSYIDGFAQGCPRWETLMTEHVARSRS